MSQQNICLSDMAEEFYKQDRIDRVNEILNETRVLKEFQHLMVKHAFDCMSGTFQEFYYNQEKFLALLKKQYQEKYGI